MHADRDAEHRAHGDEVGTDVAVGDGAVVGTPVVHHLVGGLEGRALLAVTAGREPGAGPGRVGSLHESIRDLVGQMDGI